MSMDELLADPFFVKFLQKLAIMLGTEYQKKAATMTPDEIVEDSEFFPEFNPTLHNYLQKDVGYVCRTPSGNMVYLLQPYDSSVYTDVPENLPAQWGFYWSSDPKKAKPFVKSATSPYNKGMCCMENGIVYRSLADNNVYAPSEYSTWWEVVPMIEPEGDTNV